MASKLSVLNYPVQLAKIDMRQVAGRILLLAFLWETNEELGFENNMFCIEAINGKNDLLMNMLMSILKVYSI